MSKIKKTIWFAIIPMVFFVANITPAYALSIMVHVPEKYTDVEAGERFYFELEIKYPENPRRKDLRLEYNIASEEGETIAQAKHLKAIETQASFMDYIVIPESAEKGLHSINVKISDYEDLKADVFASFNVVASGAKQMEIYFFILLGVMIFIGIMIWIDILIDRNQSKKLDR